MSYRPVPDNDALLGLRWTEGVFLADAVSSRGFGLSFLLKWGGFPVRSRRGPVGGASAKRAYHLVCGEGRYCWFRPVGNCRLFNGGLQRELAG